MESLRLRAVTSEEKATFLEMAKQYFTELNPDFVPRDEWGAQYFESIQSSESMFLRWIILDGERIGFIIYGIENHRFMPTRIGVIYEFYVAPAHRRKGLGRECAMRVIEEMRGLGISRIQLEVVVGNQGAVAFWEKLGFYKVSERFMLRCTD